MIRPQEPGGCTSPYRRSGARSISPPVVDADVPVAALVGLARGTRAAEGHGLDARDAAEDRAQLGD
jgi:hypothetical protein